MNIVIKAGSASLTQFSSNLSYSLEDIKVYSDKEIKSVKLIADNLPYPCAVINTQTVLGDFTLYTLNATIAENNYIISFTMEDDTTVSLSTAIHLRQAFSNNDLQDEHTALLVIDRTIQIVPNQVTLVAEDILSQQIRFKIRKRYDNISFLDSSKHVYIDYIPANWDMVKEELAEVATEEQKEILKDLSFIHSPVSIEENPVDTDYSYIRWDVPYLATCKAGTLTIALSIATENADYLWQTTSAHLTVQPNIGLRKNKGNINVSTINNLDARISALEHIFSGEEDSPIVLIEGGNLE